MFNDREVLVDSIMVDTEVPDLLKFIVFFGECFLEGRILLFFRFKELAIADLYAEIGVVCKQFVGFRRLARNQFPFLAHFDVYEPQFRLIFAQPLQWECVEQTVKLSGEFFFDRAIIREQGHTKGVCLVIN